MSRRRRTFNPFYALVVIAGTAFAVTATAYGIMALKATRPSAKIESAHPLLIFLDQYGIRLMTAELVALATTSFLAMGSDRFWSETADRRQIEESNGAADDRADTD